MQPKADALFRGWFPGCEIERYADRQEAPHILDQHFAVDTKINLPCGGFITLQEKYRRHEAIRWSDFTQEYKNAVGTTHESEGEWFKLAAQMYFVGWADEDEHGFTHHVLMDVLRYKLIVMGAGGLEAIGNLRQNNKHGRASFYTISLSKIRRAILKHNFPWLDDPGLPGHSPSS